MVFNNCYKKQTPPLLSHQRILNLNGLSRAIGENPKFLEPIGTTN